MVKKTEKKYISNWIVLPVGLTLMIPYLIWKSLPLSIVFIIGIAIALSAAITGTINFLKTKHSNSKPDNIDDQTTSKSASNFKQNTNSLWVIVLSVVAICISVASAGFSAFVYFSTPQSINSYVQTHKSELKGDKGDIGPQGLQGTQGNTGATGATGSSGYRGSIYCNTYEYSYGSSTSCY